MAEATIAIQRLTPALGALVGHVDLSQPIDPATVVMLRRALHEHEVIFIRDQRLSPAQHVQLARVFGEPELTRHPKFGGIDGHPEISVVINDAERPPDIDVWHTDMTFAEEPSAVCVLYCVEKPPTGGDTLWASLSAAYGALSPPVKALLSGRSARHALRLDNIPVADIQRLGERQVSAVHPLIRRHPESGRLALFVNSVYTRSIEGLGESESRHILAMLFEISQRPEFQVRFQWQPGSIAIWDNRCTQHYAIADYYPQRRVMHRVSVQGERPVGPS